MRKTMAVLSAAVGALAWLMLLGMPAAWAGLGFDLTGLVLSWRVLRNRAASRTEQRWALCGLLSAACAAAVCIVFLKTISVDLW